MVKRNKRTQVSSIEDSITFNYFFLLKILVILTICIIHHNFYQLNFIYDNPFLNYIWENGHSLVSVMFLMSGILYFFTSHKKIANNETTFSTFFLKKLKKFIEDSVRFYNCQFIISTHSPFLLSMNDAKVYDLDSFPVGAKIYGVTQAHIKDDPISCFYSFLPHRIGNPSLA